MVGIKSTIMKTRVRKTVNLSGTNKIHSKCNIVNVSIVNGLRQPIPFSFVLHKPNSYKVFCETETIYYKKNK